MTYTFASGPDHIAAYNVLASRGSSTTDCILPTPIPTSGLNASVELAAFDTTPSLSPTYTQLPSGVNAMPQTPAHASFTSDQVVPASEDAYRPAFVPARIWFEFTGLIAIVGVIRWEVLTMSAHPDGGSTTDVHDAPSSREMSRLPLFG